MCTRFQPYLLAFLAAFLLSLSSTLFAQPTAPDLDDELILNGWNSAVGVTFDENGTLYVWEKGGLVYLVENGVKRNTPLLDLSDEVGNWRDFGMLGFALDPNYLNNGYIYCLYVVDRHFLLNYNENNPPGANYNPNTDEYFNATIGRITRFTVSNPSNYASAAANEATRFILVGDQIDNGFPILHQSHGVGTLLFGEDGTLIASCGDGASYFTTDYGGPIGGTYTTQALADGIISNTEDVGAFRSQLLSSLNGKIIRIDPATGDGVPSNPFYENNDPDSHRSRVWALGFRNPFRMTLRPGSGSHYEGDANPGALYVGDVGWQTWEEMNVVTGPGQNFGWPLYEGMEEMTSYHNNDQLNLDAPTPNNCGGQTHFYFSELIKQSLPGGGNDPFTNPCGGGQINANDADLFVHQKPTFTTRHQQPITQVSINGYVENVGNGQPNSIPGQMYPGNASVGGAWYVGTDFPAEYQNTYFHGDYGEKWIRNFAFDNNQVPEWVRPFDQDVPNKGSVVCIASDPINGGLYFIRYGSQLRQMVYNPTGNQKPTAVATQDVSYGPNPLTVQFDGSQSSDPEGNALTYFWKFGDGSTSTQVSPSHTFTTVGNAPTEFEVTLIVTDNANNKDSTKLVASVNNTPPVVQSTSVDGMAYYSVSTPTQIQLSATLSDAEHPVSSLELAWQVFLYHNNHNHPEPVVYADHDDIINTVLSPVGCDGETYFYRVELTVTDPAGLSTFYYHDIYPDCGGNSNNPPVAIATADQNQGTLSLTVNFDGSSSYDLDGSIASYDWSFGDGTTGTGATPSHTFGVGNFNVVLTVTDNEGATAVDQLSIQVDGPNQPPVASFSANPNPVSLGQNVFFDGSASTDPDGSLVSFAWDFDDGNTATGTNANHTFADTGWYEVQLVVVDDEGATDTQQVQVRVDTALPPPVLKVEKGVLSNVGDAWQTVTLNYTYSNMVVVTTPALASSSDLSVVPRIQNASGNSFEIKLQGFGGHQPSGYTVHYLVVEAGSYNLADHGVKMEAGTFNSTITAGIDNWVMEARGYQQTYTYPIVVGQVMSYNDPNWSTFWASGNSRQASPSSTVFHAGKNIGEDPITTRANETLGYVVFEAGPGQINGVNFVAGEGGDIVKGVANGPNGFPYPPVGMSNPDVAIVTMSSGIDAVDGGWPILMGPNPVSAAGLVLNIDEDQTGNLERKHSTETLPYVVFEGGPANVAPTAQASADQQVGTLSLTVQFDGSGSSDPDGSIVDYAWDFGDGNFANGSQVSHTYGPGTFEAVLTVTDDQGAVDSDTVAIEVDGPNQPPVASFSASPNPVTIGGAVQLDGSASTDADGNVVAYAWDLDDGNTGTGPSLSHTYADTGWYEISLVVTDNEAATDTQHMMVRVDTVVPPPPVPTLRLEKGILTNVGDNWQTVNLNYPYDNMVVVATVALSSSAQEPAVPRIRNTSGNSFDIRLQGFGSPLPADYTVHYLVVEAGTYNLNDHGVKMEAGTFNSTLTAGLNNWITEARSYQQTYSYPIVLGQVMSYNDPNWSTFWANGSSRQASPSPTVFHAGKNVGEDPNTTRANETLGYVVFEAGSGTVNGIGFVAGEGGDNVKGIGNGPNGFPYPPVGMSNPDVAIVSMGSGMDATDGGWPILMGPNPVSSTGLVLNIDEDQTSNLERNHSTETLPFVVFEGGPVNLPPVAIATADNTVGTGSLLVNVDGTASSDPDGTLVSYQWDFGDGTQASGAIASHTFGVGTFQVVLTVTDDQGASATDEFTVSVAGPNQPPTAAFTANPDPATVGLPVQFDGSASSDVDGSIQSYSWDFDDGNGAAGVSPSHTYIDTGWYAVSLTVTDDDGDMHTTTQNLRVDTPAVATGITYEIGVLTTVGDSWQTVPLSFSYSNMVVLTTVNLSSGTQLPVVSRVRNAAGNSFEVKVEGFAGHQPSGYTVHYFVVEAGIYTVANDGVAMEAGTFSSTLTAGRDNWLTEARSYQQSYTNPVVLGQVMTANDPDWSVFWANGSSQAGSPTATVFHAGKNVGEDPDQIRANETIGYVVFESGQGSLSGRAFDVGLGADIVKGLENNANGFVYPVNGLTNPEVAILSMGAGMDAVDGGWPILFGANPVSPSQLTLLIDEDQEVSTERRHSTESVTYLVFEGSSPRLPKPGKTAVKVYPNPFDQFLYLEVDNWEGEAISLRWFNPLGQQILTQTISQANQLLEMDANWPEGMYMLQVQIGNMIQNFRLQKQ